MHPGREIQKGVDLPPEELELFELTRGPQAPARCRAYLAPVAGVQANPHCRTPYCNEACRTAGMQVVCWTCKAPATLVGDWRHCEACATPGRQPLKPLKGGDSELHATLQRNRALTLANNMWGYDLAPMDKDPEGKRRKRA